MKIAMSLGGFCLQTRYKFLLLTKRLSSQQAPDGLQAHVHNGFVYIPLHSFGLGFSSREFKVLVVVALQADGE
jgi:hypothetical protein